ncbi:MAG: eukaryotic-like serine/threonine-protein kinase [Solirubrobacteraceae bacterium]|nr:eukaryotic-like serine/threonine-protein kinase [Solirubrobacteraceae bacterium]
MPSASEIELPERYRVARHIASGGMASVWEAEDQLLGRIVAVKVLGSNFAAERGGRIRFQREARTAAQVSDQPHVVTIYDVGEHGEQAYIVMEHFGGGTVADRMRAARAAGETLPRELVMRWLREAAAGLDVAHEAGIVHRDVKPGNLMLDDQDRLAVGDFGIARLADDTHMTQAGQVLGTAAYLSPEQALGRPATAASDRYALAVVAYELLTGERPFSGGPPTATARQHVEAPPPRASDAARDLPPAVDSVLARGLAKEPSDRPPTATAFVDELDHALRGTTGPTSVLPGRRERVRARRFGLTAELGLAAALVTAVLAIVLIGSGGGDTPSRRSPARASSSPGSAAKRGAAAKPAAPAAESTPPPASSATASGTDPAALDARGFGLIRQGSYAAAVPFERQAVAGFQARGDRSSPGYAYALYNLGTALNRSGSSRAAIPYLQERLAISNDRRGVVEQELRRAQQAVGGTAPPSKAPKAHGKKPKKN